MHAMSKVDDLDGLDESAEPRPATFDQMASYLVAWPTTPTLWRWMDQREAKETHAWPGKREIVSPRKRPAIAKALKLDEPRSVLTWEDMQERLVRMRA